MKVNFVKLYLIFLGLNIATINYTVWCMEEQRREDRRHILLKYTREAKQKEIARKELKDIEDFKKGRMEKAYQINS